MLTQGEPREHGRRTAAATLLAAALLALAACSGPGNPTPPPSSSGTPSTSAASTLTPSPTPAPPREPALPAQVESEAGAVAMMRYVFELYTYAFATNDAAGFDPISAKDCTFCSNVRRDVAKNETLGRSVRGALITVDTLTAREVDEHKFFGTASIREAPSSTVDADAAVVRSEPGGAVDVEFALGWSGGRWLIRELEAKPSGESSGR